MKKKHVKKTSGLPLLGLVALFVLIAGFAAALITSRMSQDQRSDASEGSLAPNSHQPVQVWPSNTLISIGNGANQFPMPSQTTLMSPLGSQGETFQRLQRPMAEQFVFAVLPMFTEPDTDWDTSTTVNVYGWTTAPCTTNNLSFEFYKLGKDSNNHWIMSSTNSINFGTLNEQSTNGNDPSFCIPDPAKEGWNAFRLSAVSGSVSATSLEAATLRLSYANSGSDTTHIAKVLVDTPIQSWPPTEGRMCGDSCSTTAVNVPCEDGYVCDYSKTKSKTWGICVTRACQNQSCYCD